MGTIINFNKGKKIVKLKKELNEFENELKEKQSEMDSIKSELEDEAKKHGMTVDEFIKWFSENNSEIDWGEPVGDERFWETNEESN